MFWRVRKLCTYAKNTVKKTQKSLAMTGNFTIKNFAHFFLHKKKRVYDVGI